MNTNLFRIVYCSRNRLHGTVAEVSNELNKILSKARANNSKAQVTGALLYNAGNFAQVLEGRLDAVERIFEKIQRDPRHTEVTVIQIGSIAVREFPEWAMAFAGSSEEDRMPEASAAFQRAFNNSENSSEVILGMLRNLVIQENDWTLLDAA